MPLLRAHFIHGLRTIALARTCRPTLSSALDMGQRLYSQYSVVPVPKNLIPRLNPSNPQILWLGCCDSGYDETTTLDLFPNEMIVVRNVGNMALSTDLAWSSAVQHAVDSLQVNHIVVCGHYGCGIVKANPTASFNSPWQREVNSLLSKHQEELECLSANDRNHRLVQVNVVKQMQLVKEFLQVMYPEEHDHISIHGFLYDRMRNRADRVLLHH